MTGVMPRDHAPVPTVRESPAGEPTKHQVLVLGGLLLICAVVCGVLGYVWTRKPAFPRFPIPCIGRIHGSCWEEQSGVFLYVDKPQYPVALKVTYGQTVYGPQGVTESVWIGADIPDHQTLHWMLQL